MRPECRLAQLDRFVALIAAHGYPGSFWHRHWTYVDVDGWKYWRSNTLDGSGGLIVNRAHLLEGGGVSTQAERPDQRELREVSEVELPRLPGLEVD